MVRVGFIVEGASEKIVVESAAFKAFLAEQNYQLVTPVIDAKGGGNLLPQNIEEFVVRLSNNNVDSIFILTDLEDESCAEEVKQRVAHAGVNMTFVAVKALEAWFLADTQAMNQWLRRDDFFEALPEETTGKPW